MLGSTNSQKIKGTGYDHFCGSISEMCQAEDIYLVIYCLFDPSKIHHGMYSHNPSNVGRSTYYYIYRYSTN